MTSTMSEGITAYDFVQQVYYAQEKTLLDWWPTDDKFREVLVEANLVLRELEAQQDWTWLRDTIVLGTCDNVTDDILEFSIRTNNPDVYKLSTLNHDILRLQPIKGQDSSGNYVVDNRFAIPIPISSAGDQRFRRQIQENWIGVNHVIDHKLKAVVHGDTIKFNRPLTPFEANNTVLVADVQKHIVPFHVCVPGSCSLNGSHRCTTDLNKKYLKEVPDPNYVIMATAARHAEGSPPALARVAGLQDAAQRILSQMRQNDAEATDSDYVEWDVPGYLEVI